ncbi:MAG TPA: ACT domain-containing protein [Candidatus Acidoferrum sp.]|jgi:hypothetical protein
MAADSRALTLSVLRDRYTILQFAADAVVPGWAMRGEFFSVTRNPDELSIVTQVANLPVWETAETEWRVFNLHGPFAFHEIGVLASLTAPLAAGEIGLFVISTFDTDYLLVQSKQTVKAVECLRAAGHNIVDSEFIFEEAKEKEG